MSAAPETWNKGVKGNESEASYVLKPHRGLIELVGPQLVMLRLGSLSVLIALEACAATGRHILEASAKSSLFPCQLVKALEILPQKKVWVCEIEGEGSIRRWTPESLPLVEARPDGTCASDKHLANVVLLCLRALPLARSKSLDASAPRRRRDCLTDDVARVVVQYCSPLMLCDLSFCLAVRRLCLASV